MFRHPVLGAVTIGQSPRSDVIPELQDLLGPNVEIREAGALDRFSPEQIAQLAPAPGDQVLATRLRDGSSVEVARGAILPLVQTAFDSLAGRVDTILMLCTGTLPAFHSPHPVLYPEHLLFNVAKGILTPVLERQETGIIHSLGVITPSAGQIDDQRQRWEKVLGQPPLVAVCSPYESPEKVLGNLQLIGSEFKQAGVSLIALDCLGYSRWMKAVIHDVSGLPVVLARSILGRVASELLDIQAVAVSPKVPPMATSHPER